MVPNLVQSTLNNVGGLEQAPPSLKDARVAQTQTSHL